MFALKSSTNFYKTLNKSLESSQTTGSVGFVETNNFLSLLKNDIKVACNSLSILIENKLILIKEMFK